MDGPQPLTYPLYVNVPTPGGSRPDTWNDFLLELRREHEDRRFDGRYWQFPNFRVDTYYNDYDVWIFEEPGIYLWWLMNAPEPPCDLN